MENLNIMMPTVQQALPGSSQSRPGIQLRPAQVHLGWEAALQYQLCYDWRIELCEKKDKGVAPSLRLVRGWIVAQLLSSSFVIAPLAELRDVMSEHEYPRAKNLLPMGERVP